MPPRTSMKIFLATARAALTAPPSKRTRPLTFVVGNESADLDSLCSALLLAYFHTYAPPKKRDGSLAVSTLHIPVCHLQRADLALRPEKDSTGTESIRPEDTHWLLVDHNAMTGTLANKFASRVFGCVDHHADEDVIPRDTEVRVIDKSGSCMSLVLERCADTWEALGTGDGSAGAEIIDAQLARLALAPILIDTANLGDKNKTTAHDERAVALAESKMEGQGYDRDVFFNRLSELKEDIADMSLRDVFRKDYKEWRVRGLNLGTSSVPRGFAYLNARGESGAFGSALRDWAGERDGRVDNGEKMDLVVLLTTFQDKDGRFCRELLLWARSEAGIRAAELFEETYADKLRLEAWGDGVLDIRGDDDGTSEWRRCWAQRAVEHSRKQIAPMLRDALKEVSGRA
ncbi:hypothetical protein E0Z10_g5001 [Xylaria hypoxylon]|uniref:DHHA2 domain-containing protein n=1 Tax=Xylaria hypoxylon TaxID=37992 RepID=A0A4Z0YZ16_9PEZI|nr:hypothetical protein E0Z10_g5001 [Xylaria hypoxylon]